MRRIYIKGYYGFKNFGDDIFMLVSQHIFDNHLTEFTPIYIGTDLPIVSSTYNITLRPRNQTMRRFLELKNIFRCEYILYFGGSLFTSGGKNIFDIKYLFRKMNRFNKRLLTFGVSIGPFKDEVEMKNTSDLLSKFAFVGVRDFKSEEFTRIMPNSINTVFSFDNAIYLRRMYPEYIKHHRSKESNILGVSLCNYEKSSSDQSDFTQNLVALKKTIEGIVDQSNNIIIRFFVFNGSGDYGDDKLTDDFIEYFCKLAKCEKYSYSNNPEDHLKGLSSIDFMLGVRLHSAIISYTFDIPFLLVEYHSKCTEFLNTINYEYRFCKNDISQNIRIISTSLSGSNPQQIRPEIYLDIFENALSNLKSIIMSDQR